MAKAASAPQIERFVENRWRVKPSALRYRIAGVAAYIRMRPRKLTRLSWTIGSRNGLAAHKAEGAGHEGRTRKGEELLALGDREVIGSALIVEAPKTL